MEHQRYHKQTASFSVIAILGIILILSLVMRLWGNDFGLPYSYHQDGARNVERSLRLLEGTLSYDVNPGWNIMMFLEFGLIYAIGSLFGVFDSLSEFIASARIDPTFVETAARSLSGLLGTATVFVVFLIGRRAYDIKSGLVAATMLGFAFLHVRDSHYSVADVPAAFFIATSSLFAIMALQKRKYSSFILAGLFGGMASATKWTSMAMVVPLFIAIALGHPGPKWRDRIQQLLTDKALYGTFIGFGVGIVILGPQHLIDPLRLVQEGMQHQAGLTFGGLYIDTLPGWIFYIKTLAWGLGLPLLVTVLAGVAWAVYRRSKEDILLLSFPIIYYLIMGTTWHYFSRYTISLLPFLVVFGGRFLVDMVNRLPVQKEFHKVLAMSIFTIILVALPLRSSILHNLLLEKADTRTIAGDWFESNVSDGVKIAAELHTPFFRDQVGGSGPLLPRRGEDRYQISEISWSASDHYKLEKYLKNGTDYIVTSSFITSLRFTDQTKTELRQEFYKTLDEKAQLIAEFRPYSENEPSSLIWAQMYGPATSLTEIERPGPTIKIYKLNSYEATQQTKATQ